MGGGETHVRSEKRKLKFFKAGWLLRFNLFPRRVQLPGTGPGIHTVGCDRYRLGLRTSRIKTSPGISRPPESPDRNALPPPRPRRLTQPREEAAERRTRTRVTAFSPPHAGWRHGAEPDQRRRRWPYCYQASSQPISSCRQRRPAFELRTVTSCCLASTQCNAVCLSALRHKGTAILWLSWTCTKMPGAPSAAACAKYRAAPLFITTAPMGAWGREGSGISGFN